MNRFSVPTREQVEETARPVFDNFTKLMGKMPNLYAAIGYSANALHSYVAYTQAQAKGSFHAKDREAVYLMVSELNGCEYCKASHTQSAIKNGWTLEETQQLRAGTYASPKWQAIYGVISAVISNKGAVGDELLDLFFAQGYDNKALMDLMVLINVMSFTNYVYRLVQVPIDFPPAT